jgi:hypothetical protein
MSERKYAVIITRLQDQDDNPELRAMSSAERLEMMWPLAMDTWAFMGDPVVAPRLPRHIIRVIRKRK